MVISSLFKTITMVDEGTGGRKQLDAVDFKGSRSTVDSTPTLEQIKIDGYEETLFAKVDKGNQVFVKVNKPAPILGRFSLDRFIGTIFIKQSKTKKQEGFLILYLTDGPGKGSTHQIYESDIDS